MVVVTHGSPADRAEREDAFEGNASDRRNLIRVMPAKGVPTAAQGST